jgi:hypothetical protein
MLQDDDDDNKEWLSIDPSVLQDFDYWDYKERVETEISVYEEYLETMESFLRAKVLQHSSNIKRAIESGNITDIDEDGDAYDVTEYDHFMLGKVNSFQNLLRQSFFTSLFTFFETKLVEECVIRKSDNEPLLLSDIRGQDELEKVKIYFSKVLQLSFPSESAEWMEITKLRRVRNLVVHNRGRISGKYRTQDLLSYIEHSTYLEEIEQQIFIKAGFCKHALKTFKAFLMMLTFDEFQGRPAK